MDLDSALVDDLRRAHGSAGRPSMKAVILFPVMMIGFIGGLATHPAMAGEGGVPTVSTGAGTQGDPHVSSAAVSENGGPVAVPPPSEKALRYYRSGNVIWTVEQVLGLALPALLLFTGLSARLRTFAAGLGLGISTRRWSSTWCCCRPCCF